MNDLLSRSFNGGDSSAPDLEGGVELIGGPNMARFQADVTALESEMDKVQNLLKQLEQNNEESRTVTSAQAMKHVRERMDSLITEVLREAKFIKSKLEALDKANRDSRQIPGCEEGTTIDRMRMNITDKQRSKLHSLMQSFDRLRQKLQAEYRETIKRRYHTVTGVDATDDMIDQMIATGESETFLQKAVREQGRGHILNTIEEIKERHDAVKEMEKSLLELYQIFMDMGVLVDAQGLQIKTIEDAVVDARSYVDKGTKQLAIARKTQKNTRKWTFICILILLIIIIIVVVLVVKK